MQAKVFAQHYIFISIQVSATKSIIVQSSQTQHSPSVVAWRAGVCHSWSVKAHQPVRVQCHHGEPCGRDPLPQSGAGHTLQAQLLVLEQVPEDVPGQ